MTKYCVVVTMILLMCIGVFAIPETRIPNKFENMVNATVLITDGIGWGSGVFIEDNVIVTAAHVLQHPGLTIELTDGTILDVVDFYVDDKEDVGFIFVDANELSIANVSESSGNIGDTVYSVGGPVFMDLKFTISQGILSHLDREDLLQADVVSGPGCSGGPLYDSTGKVIGIMVANPSPHNTGNITLCESAKSILEAYERAKKCR